MGNKTRVQIPQVVVKWITYALVLHIVALVLAAISSIFGLLAHVREFSMSCFSSCISGLGAAITALLARDALDRGPFLMSRVATCHHVGTERHALEPCAGRSRISSMIVLRPGFMPPGYEEFPISRPLSPLMYCGALSACRPPNFLCRSARPVPGAGRSARFSACQSRTCRPREAFRQSATHHKLQILLGEEIHLL